MEPFNLEKALAGDPVVTRTGENVTQIHLFDAKDMQGAHACYPVYGILKGRVTSFTEKGTYNIKEGNDFDLFMKPKVIEGWINIYEEQGILWTSVAHDSEEEAKEKILSIMSAKYIKTIKITNEI